MLIHRRSTNPRETRPASRAPRTRPALISLLLVAALSACGGDDPGEELDTTPPSAPAKLVALGVRGPAALSWQASTDDVGVLGYRVYRDGVAIADVEGTSYRDTFAKATLPKTCKGNLYKVEAYDAAGNTSAASAEVRSTLAIKNLIFMIGDGMGPLHQKAAGCYLFGASQGQPGSTLSFEALPVKGTVTTASADSAVTDSAAAATAMATGVKVNNEAISVAAPGDGKDLYTLLECFKDQGRATGLVTTTELSHATPAAFGAHTSKRDDVAGIVSDYLKQSKPNVLFGGAAGAGITPAAAKAAGYTVVTTRAELNTLPASATHVSGQFAAGHMPYEYDAANAATNPYDTAPHLSESVKAALKLLESSTEGFFMLVEGGRIDHASHLKDLDRALFEVVEFDKTARQVLDWAKGRNDTLVIVTADHETGDLDVYSCNAKGQNPAAMWNSQGHTSADVNVHADGPCAKELAGKIDNTDFFDAITACDKGS